MTIKEIYASKFAEKPAKSSNYKDAIQDAVAQIIPLLEENIRNNVMSMDRNTVKTLVEKEEANGNKCNPAVQVNFSNSFIWEIKTGIMVCSKTNCVFHSISSSRFNAFQIIGSFCKHFNRHSFDRLFSDEQKISFSLQNEDENAGKKVMFVFV